MTLFCAGLSFMPGKENCTFSALRTLSLPDIASPCSVHCVYAIKSQVVYNGCQGVNQLGKYPQFPPDAAAASSPTFLHGG